jgi:hypothetical protein
MSPFNADLNYASVTVYVGSPQPAQRVLGCFDVVGASSRLRWNRDRATSATLTNTGAGTDLCAAIHLCCTTRGETPMFSCVRFRDARHAD